MPRLLYYSIEEKMEKQPKVVSNPDDSEAGNGSNGSLGQTGNLKLLAAEYTIIASWNDWKSCSTDIKTYVSID